MIKKISIEGSVWLYSTCIPDGEYYRKNSIFKVFEKF